MTPEEAERRDRVLRAYFAGRDWDGDGEFRLKRDLAMSDPAALASYPLLVDDEWEVEPGQTNKGRGDLVFTDGEGRWAVVETKWIDGGTDGGSGKTRRRSRTEKRRKVEDQAIQYASLLRHFRVSGADVAAFFFTNEGGLSRADGPLLDEDGIRAASPELFRRERQAAEIRRLLEEYELSDLVDDVPG